MLDTTVVIKQLNLKLKTSSMPLMSTCVSVKWAYFLDDNRRVVRVASPGSLCSISICSGFNTRFR